MTTSLRAALVLCLVLLASGAAPGSVPMAGAAASTSGSVTFQVNSPNDVIADFTNDPGFTVCHTGPANTTCTLRAAIMNANRHGGSATIQLPAGTYVIQVPPSGLSDDASGDLNISSTVTIAGAGAASTIVDGSALDDVFFINPDAVVTMTGLTIRNGNSHNFLLGGGIFDEGWLSLSNSVVSHNFANLAGGGLFIDTGGAASLDRVTVTGNSNGGIDNDGSLTITNSSLYANFAASHDGGAIANENGSHLMVFNSTLSNNGTGGNGGAIKNSGTATILASTIAGNLADDQALGLYTGGGIFNGGAGSLQMTDTLLADNFVSHTVNECQGTPLTSGDYDYFDTTQGCSLTGITSDNVITESNLLLGPLADNGGATETRALFPGHPAIDQIPPAVCRDPLGAASVSDQRGVVRPSGPRCDMGAFEGSTLLSAYFRNLVVNGNGEASAGAPTGAWVAPASWVNQSGQFTVVAYNAPGGFPAVPTDTVPADHGANFFAGGQAAGTTGTQVIPVPPELSASVSAGDVSYLFSADLGGFGNQDDNAQVLARFENATFGILGSALLGPITAAERGNQTKFIHTEATGLMPPHTVWIVLDVILTRVFTGGSDNDGYADNISLVLLPKHALFLPTLYQ